jgi:Na+/phosphate symporter
MTVNEIISKVNELNEVIKGSTNSQVKEVYAISQRYVDSLQKQIPKLESEISRLRTAKNNSENDISMINSIVEFE